MSLVNANLLDFIGAVTGFTLTLFVFSYVWGENPFFRIATHLFVGVAAGYAAVMTIYHVILPHLIFPLLSDNRGELILAVIYLIPSAMILTKMSPRLSKIGNPAMAILVGIGAAAAVGGTVFGTIFPQVSQTTKIFETENFINAGVILLGTLTTLIYFHFGVNNRSKNLPIGQFFRGMGWVGQIFIAMTFGTLFAGVYFTALTAMVERLSSLWVFVQGILASALSG